MRLPVFFPPIRYQREIAERGIPLFALCQSAGVECKAVGRWVNREIVMRLAGAPGDECIICEPWDWQKVMVVTPVGVASARARARWVLGALAYAVFDGVARASIAGQSWARAALPRGPATAHHAPISNAERQRRFRQRQRGRELTQTAVE